MPKQLGWDYLEEDSLTCPDFFNRVDTSVAGGKIFTTVRRSVVEQRRQKQILDYCAKHSIDASRPVQETGDNSSAGSRMCAGAEKQNGGENIAIAHETMNAMGDCKGSLEKDVGENSFRNIHRSDRLLNRIYRLPERFLGRVRRVSL